MRFIRYSLQGEIGLAVHTTGGYFGVLEQDEAYPGPIDQLLAQGPEALKRAAAICAKGTALDIDAIRFLPPIGNPGKIICVGLNYADHSAESGYTQPSYPTLFARFSSSLIGHGAPILRPRVSEALDFEGELAAVIGRGGRYISSEAALDHVAGYALFNDASIRDYQHRTPQWTIGKNFDDTGAFGPEFVTADELPPACKGLQLETRLNGTVVQSAPIDDMIFDVATLVSLLSEAFTLAPGDVIVTGTPSGVGAARKPPLWMKPGDVCEVEISQLGVLRNVIAEDGGSND